MPRPQFLCEAEFARLMTTLDKTRLQSHVAVAVSGGADSMALLLLAHQWGQAQGVAITGLTVDHGLREGSSREAQQVKTWLAAHQIEHHILTWSDHGKVTTAVQARARDARYRLMGNWCRNHGILSLLLAHHQDDQAETVLMRLKKGSTLYGFGAMAPMRDCEGVTLCRPLLTVPKCRLIATLHGKNQEWVEDPSNQNTAFERVRVRAQLIELAAQGVTAKRLASAAQSARAVCDIIDVAAGRLLATTVFNTEDGHLVLAQEFLQAPNQVYGRALSRLLRTVGGTVYPPSPDKLQRLLTWMVNPTSGARTLAGVVVRVQALGFQFSAELPRKKCK